LARLILTPTHLKDDTTQRYLVANALVEIPAPLEFPGDTVAVRAPFFAAALLGVFVGQGTLPFPGRLWVAGVREA